MFFVTQLIGLAVINAYASSGEDLPYGMQPPEELTIEKDPATIVPSIVIAFIFAIILFLLLSKIKWLFLLKAWFFIVIIIALGITLNALIMNIPILSVYSAYLAFLIALPVAFFKVFKRNFLVHNLSELLIYPGIAAVFVPILGILGIIILLLIISAYDIYAVWHSGFMQRLAKFNIEKLKLFPGFFVPYLSKNQRKKIKTIKTKMKSKKVDKITKTNLKNKKMKVNLAILGGGDVVFPIITAGVVLVSLGFWKALIVSFFATFALAYLFLASKKGKFYPAMPYLTVGLLVGIAIAYLI